MFFVGKSRTWEPTCIICVFSNECIYLYMGPDACGACGSLCMKGIWVPMYVEHMGLCMWSIWVSMYVEHMGPYACGAYGSLCIWGIWVPMYMGAYRLIETDWQLAY